MITNQELMEKVDDFYNDLLQIYLARIEKNNKKIEDKRKEIEELIGKKKEKYEQLELLKENPKNHINNIKEYHLLPEKYIYEDKFNKEIDYIEEKIKFMKLWLIEETENITIKNNNCRKEIEKYFKEKMDILKPVLNAEEYQRLLHEKLQIEENKNLKRINDTILNSYIKNISTGTNNEPAPISNK